MSEVLKFALTTDGYEDVVALVPAQPEGNARPSTTTLGSPTVLGYVYMLHANGDYKIGRSNDADRRLNEVGVQLARKPDTVHAIETDDPSGIENYWHRRFATQRLNGAWFKLTPEGV